MAFFFVSPELVKLFYSTQFTIDHQVDVAAPYDRRAVYHDVRVCTQLSRGTKNKTGFLRSLLLLPKLSNY